MRRVRAATRLVLVAIAVTGFVGTTAAPALADPAGPTNYESTITAVDPSTAVATFEVVGGDAFLEVRMSPGHTLAIPGYFREPYIRIDADGTVWVNEDSPTLYENEDRYGIDDPPEEADGLGEPRWRQVADDGVYAWHDHRVHWMSRDVPPAVAGDTRQLVFPWRIPVTIDGAETLITGELVWLPSDSSLPMIAVGIAAIAAVGLVWRRRPDLLAPLAITMALAAGVVVVAQNLATPVAARGLPVWLVFPAIAALGAGFAAVGRSVAGLNPSYLLLMSGVTLTAWAFATIDVLSKPIIPSALPTVLERTVVAIVGGAGATIAILAVAGVMGWNVVTKRNAQTVR